MKKYLLIIARLCVAGIFLYSGYGKLTNVEATAGFIGAMGLPLPGVAAVLAGIVEVGCGLLLVTGFRERWVAALLFLYMIPVTAIFESPFGIEGPAFRGAMIDFFKNLAIMGGLLMWVTHGRGELPGFGDAAEPAD